MAQFTPGMLVQAKNGRGGVYMITDRLQATNYAPESYMLDNGSVHISKRGKSGKHPVERIDRYYKEVH